MSKKRKRPAVEEERKPWDSCAREALDEQIWRKLPLDMQLKLLAHLPLRAQCRFQLVCKAWYKGVRNIEQVTAHGDCYVAGVKNKPEELRLYSSRQTGYLVLHNPGYKALICTSHGLMCFHGDSKTTLYNPLTRKVIQVPVPPVQLNSPPSFLGMHGEEAGSFIVVLVSGRGSGRRLLVYKSVTSAWKSTPLQLPAGEEFSLSPGPLFSLAERSVVFHGKIDGSTLYFLTISYQPPEGTEMSVRSIDFLNNIDGISQKVFSWTTLPKYYDAYGPGPYPRRFAGNIVVVSGDLFMGCLRYVNPEKPRSYTVALHVYNKQQQQWDFVSKMPLKEGYRSWRPMTPMELWSQGDTILACNQDANFACLYNTSTKRWSLQFHRDEVTSVWPMQLSMRS